MSKVLTKLFLTTFVLIVSMLYACADTAPLKIVGLSFDNSDNLVLVKTMGNIDTQFITEHTQTGRLTNPQRAYADINNAVLTGGARSYTIKNSVLDEVKISQFSSDPAVVRLVFSYKNASAMNHFSPMVNKNGIVIRYSNNLVSNQKNHTVYSNTELSKRTVFYEGTKAQLQKDNDGTVNVSNSVLKSNPDEKKLASKFYINSVYDTQDGIMIKGTGTLSLMPAFYLENPSRMVIDIDDTVLSSSLKNKTFAIGTIKTDANGNIMPRETVKLGQNSPNVTRLVIQGNDAKNYRIVVSPDLQNFYIAKKTSIINSKITETPSTFKSIQTNTEGGNDVINLNFSNPVAFSIFEENKNLYIDLNNAPMPDASFFEALLKKYPGFQTIRIALDKSRIVIPEPVNEEGKRPNVNVKISPDAKNLIVIFKDTIENKDESDAELPRESVISKVKDKFPSISMMYKVVIDAGHGGSDVGATREGIYEKNITLSIAKMVEKNLKDKGVQTSMTLDRDKTVSLAERCEHSNNYGPDVFVSVHVNSSTNPGVYGVETHYWKTDSIEYAQTVHKHLAKNFGKWNTRDRGLFKSQFYVINHTEAPAILCEIGFISNAAERDAITTQKRQMEIAKAISDGIIEYLKARK